MIDGVDKLMGRKGEKCQPKLKGGWAEGLDTNPRDPDLGKGLITSRAGHSAWKSMP